MFYNQQITDLKIKFMRKKSLFLVAILLLCGASVFAQDIITLKNGDDIQALVQDIGEVDVKYKKFDNPNGPNYTLKKSEILMIRYANGSKDVFADNTTPTATTTPAPVVKQPSVQSDAEEVYFNFWGTLKYTPSKKKVKNVEDLFYDMPDASQIYRSGKIWNAIGTGISLGGWLIGFYDMILAHTSEYDYYSGKTYYPNGRYYNCPIFWTGIGIMIVGIPFSEVGNSKKRTAIDMYNATVKRQKTSDISLNFGITQSGGLGLLVNF